MKNPAAVYCQFMGYSYTIQVDQKGNQVGMCTLPNGQKVNAWDFYKGKVAREYSYAAKKGYSIENVIEKIDDYTIEKAICTRTLKGVQEKLTLEELMEKNGDKLQLETGKAGVDIYDIARENPNFAYAKAAPVSFDWRSYNGHSYIGAVRDQANCGSCYAFGASACAEGTFNLATGSYDGNTADYSEAYIAWCLGSMATYNDNFYGCDGADYTYSELQALCDIGTINESYFPYTDADGQSCPSAATNAPKTKFTSWYRVTCSDIEAIKTAIMTYGVVDAAVYVTTSFENYSGGIYTDSYTACSSSPCYNTPTNHAIALVGWGTNATTGDYWILRNSWGSSWGESGYMRIDATSSRVACEVCYLVYSAVNDTEKPTAPTNLASSNVTSTSATLNWTASTDNIGVTGYTIYQNGTLKGTSATNSYTVTGLTASTTYTFYVTAFDAAGNISAASSTINVTTPESSIIYCTSKGNSVRDEWIDLVKLGTINNVTGANAGYADFTSLSTILDKGASYTINFSAGFTSTAYTEYWYIWIDYDRDGTFETDELINSTSSSSSATLSKTFTVPATASTGSTRMRVSMKYNAAPTACETFSYGEVEDYTIVINAGTPDTQAPTAPTNLVSSGITQTTATLNWTASTDNVGVTGYNVYRNGSLLGAAASASYNVTGLTAATTYSFYVTAYDAAGNVSAASATISVTTLPASVTYCASKGSNVTYEWIDLVKLNTINNVTAANGGYGDFTSQSTSLARGSSYTVYFSAGFKSTAYTEYWYIWIDYDRDGTFESTELISSGSSKLASTLSKTFTVPSTASIGSTRMRVTMKYNSAPTACETFSYGEVEDYTIVLTGTSSSIKRESIDSEEIGNEPPTSITVYPNPVNNTLIVKINDVVEFNQNTVKIYNSDGRLVMITTLDKAIDVSGLSAGLYIISVDDPKESFVTEFVKE
jgi:chitodextrinase/C1A family cysteine protease